MVALTSHSEEEILAITLDTGEDGGDNNLQQQLNSDDDQQSKISKMPERVENLKSKMEVTSEHPVYVEGKGWIWAENLFSALIG